MLVDYTERPPNDQYGCLLGGFYPETMIIAPFLAVVWAVDLTMMNFPSEFRRFGPTMLGDYAHPTGRSRLARFLL
jgi:hypothetical protein